ncbi:NADPH-dependent FMN reductase family protein [Streptomyces anulatus]|uniref:hypothetical protein n=1 Tax=Streptomyces anulatus TaxID=1892 RepID=UPI0036DDBB75
MLADRDQSRRVFLYPNYSHPETIDRGAAAVALKRTLEATTDDVLEIDLYEFGSSSTRGPRPPLWPPTA